MSSFSCRDCANFEDRRCLEGVALCGMHHGPSVCCQEFRSREEKAKLANYDMFCLNCVNYQDIDGVSICAKHHRPGIACSAFKAKDQTRPIIALAP